MEKSTYTWEYEIFLDLLRQIRLDASLTQVGLAERIDENQVFVSRFERGETRLDIVQIRMICRAMGWSLCSLAAEYERRLAEELGS